MIFFVLHGPHEPVYVPGKSPVKTEVVYCCNENALYFLNYFIYLDENDFYFKCNRGVKFYFAKKKRKKYYNHVIKFIKNVCLKRHVMLK